MCGYGAVFVKHLLELMSFLVTVRETRRGSDITGHKELVALCNYAP
jgi:hypothetical protein